MTAKASSRPLNATLGTYGVFPAEHRWASEIPGFLVCEKCGRRVRRLAISAELRSPCPAREDAP